MITNKLRRVLLVSLTLLIVGAVAVSMRTLNVESRIAGGIDESPEACVNRMLNSEESGDADACLECFSKAERERRKSEWNGLSSSQIATDLRAQHLGIVGQAVTGLKIDSPDHASLVLERIHRDYTDLQKVTFVREGGRWQIATLSKPEKQTPAIPYGTPVSE